MRSVIPISARRLRLNVGSGSCTQRHAHATSWVSNSVKEKISEVADKVNKKIGEGLATAIETGQKATGKTRQFLGATTKRVSDKSESKSSGTQSQEEGVSDAKETERKPKNL